MSEPEKNERTSVIDLEATLRTADVEIPTIESEPEPIARPKPHPPAQNKVQKKTTQGSQSKVHKKTVPSSQSKMVELKTLQKEKLQSIIKKHHDERKFLQNALKEQSRKSKDDLKLALGQTEKNYRTQLELLRKDYQIRSVTIQNELKDFLATEMTEMKKHSENLVMTDSQNRIEKLEKWLHGEFVAELQNKTNELEQIKAQADVQAHDLVKEIDQKNKEIVFLQSKIKEISHHLKRGMREEIFEELGLEEDEDKGKGKKKKPRQKGLLARLGF